MTCDLESSGRNKYWLHREENVRDSCLAKSNGIQLLQNFVTMPVNFKK